MPDKILILYASVDGQTLKIVNHLSALLKEAGQEVIIFEISDFSDELALYDKIIIGCSIRYGLHHKDIIDFINKNIERLDSFKTAFFSVNLVARKPEKNQADTNPYVIKFFNSIQWRPNLIDVFAGKLDYKKYPFFDRIMIQLIMWMTNGPTDSNTKKEYTDWSRVAAFSDKIVSL